MNIQPQPDPREQLTEPQQALYDTVRQVAGRTSRDCADILYNDSGTFAITAGPGDVAAVDAALAGVPATAGLPGCGRPAAARIEIYSPRDGTAHGSLDASLYVCGGHHAPVTEAIAAADLTPYTVPGTTAGPKRCGAGWDFITGSPINAPEPADGDPAHGNSGPGGPLPATPPPPEDDAPEYRVVIRDAADDSYVDVMRDGAVIVTWTFEEACQVAQQLADQFGTFTGPASARGSVW